MHIRDNIRIPLTVLTIEAGMLLGLAMIFFVLVPD